MPDETPIEVPKPSVTPASEDDKDDAEYTTVPKEYKFSVTDEKGKKERYVLREFYGPGLTQWTEIHAARLKFSKTGAPLPRDSDYSNLYSSLIALCCYNRTTGHRVSKNVIESWTSSIQSDLFDRCQQMNGLTEDGREKAKND